MDLGSQKNLIYEALMKKMGLMTIAHPKPYGLGKIQKDADLMITKQCTFKFAITERFIDKVTCEVILGSTYLWDRDVIHYHRVLKYSLVKGGNEFHINACKEHVTTSNLVMTTQVKQLVSASDKFGLLVRPVQEGTSARVLSPMTLFYKQQPDL
ncbi:hypothetical protein GIB67_038108, partial [Kingdonia uniflora]